MYKRAILATLLACGPVAAYAQTAPAPNGPALNRPAATAADRNAPSPDAADANKLIGHKVVNAQNETIGSINSVYIAPDGKVDSVMVGVGGFLGVGEREVRLGWKDLHVMDNGNKVTVDMTKDQLKAMPEYKYANAGWRGRAFNDKGPWTADQHAAADARTTTDRSVAANHASDQRTNDVRTTSTGDFNASGDMSTSAIVGTRVRNAANDTVGKVEDLYVDKSGAIKTVVVSVGGFLGVGSKDVAVKWSDIKFGRDGDSIVLNTSWTKDTLKAMPDYKYERRRPADDQAAAPPAKPRQ
jgi:sporulation protein YlmC with PRC-barrel domain